MLRRKLAGSTAAGPTTNGISGVYTTKGVELDWARAIKYLTPRHRWLREITPLAKRPGPFAKHNGGKTVRVPQVVKVCLFNDSQQETRCLSSRGPTIPI
jgi:hypothetical protein